MPRTAATASALARSGILDSGARHLCFGGPDLRVLFIPAATSISAIRASTREATRKPS